MRHPRTFQRLSVGFVSVAAVGTLGTAAASAAVPVGQAGATVVTVQALPPTFEAMTVSAAPGASAAQKKNCAAWNHDVQILDRIHTGALYAHNGAVVASSSSALNDYTTAATAEGCTVSPA